MGIGIADECGGCWYVGYASLSGATSSHSLSFFGARIDCWDAMVDLIGNLLVVSDKFLSSLNRESVY